jgi:adenylate cyclase
MLEIERRFLINEIPEDLKLGKGTPIAQGYLAVGSDGSDRSEGSDGSDGEVRLRRYGKKLFLTAKRGGGMVRREFEVPLQAKQFDELWPGTEKLRVEKSRHLVSDEAGTIEIDIFEGALKGFRLAEIEFPDQEKAKAFCPPWWFGPEVSEDRRFRNSSLASSFTGENEALFKKLTAPPIPAVGAIPFLMMNDERHYVLITTRSTGRWIFPKGGPESKKSDKEMALIEAEEEAGVTGKIVGEPVPTWYWKEYDRYQISFYPMAVDNLMMKWDEAKMRQRRVCTFNEAKELLTDQALRRSLSIVESSLKGKKS